MKDEWVLIVDAEFASDFTVRSGPVAAHSPDREEVWRKAIELQPASSTVEYTGELKFDGEYCISMWSDDDLAVPAPEPAGADGKS